MNPWFIIFWLVVMLTSAIAQIGIGLSGWQPNTPYTTQDDPSPGPTALH